jgi:hypothetical protein
MSWGECLFLEGIRPRRVGYFLNISRFVMMKRAGVRHDAVIKWVGSRVTLIDGGNGSIVTRFVTRTIGGGAIEAMIIRTRA